MRRHVRRALVLASTGLLTTSLLAACSTDTGGVMVVMRTDMTFPAKVKVVGLYIDQITDGRRTSLLSKEVPTSSTNTETSVSLPSNFAIQNDGESSQVRVRVIAYDENMLPIAMRESLASVSNTRLDAMPMPMLWMNGDDVTVIQDDDPMTRFQSSTCGVDQTLGDDGACVPIRTELQPYAPTEPAEVPAGACNPNCFDVSECFKPEFAEDLDEDFKAARAPIGWFDEAAGECGVALGARGDMARAVAARADQLSTSLAVAVRVRPEDGAHCTKQDPNECYIVLDAASNMSVVRKATPQGERLWALLPKGVCRKWAAGKIYRNTAVAVPGCNRKDPNQTLCGASEVGCTTDVGWDGTKNPRARKQGTSPAASEVCLVPGATSLWGNATSLVAMNDQGQILTLPPNLQNCAPTSTSPALGPGTYRFAGSDPADRLAFMRKDGTAGTAELDAGGYLGTTPAAVANSPGPWGVGFATQGAKLPCFLGQKTGLLGNTPLDGLPYGFRATSNGFDAPQKKGGGVTFLTSDGNSLGLVQCPSTAGSPAALAGLSATLDGADIPLHATGLRGQMFVLTQGQDGAPGLVRYGDGGMQRLSFALPQGEDAMAAIPWEMTLASGASSLFFGDALGRVYRATPGLLVATDGRVPTTVAYRGYEGVRSVYYQPIPGALDRTIAGFLYFLTWPDDNPALARIQRIPLDASGTVVIPDPTTADGGSSVDASSSSGNVSSSSSGDASSSSSSGGSSSGGGSSGEFSDGGSSSGSSSGFDSGAGNSDAG